VGICATSICVVFVFVSRRMRGMSQGLRNQVGNMTDPIADMITRINNARAVNKERVIMPYSMLKHSIADLLISLGYLKSVAKVAKKEGKDLDVELVYDTVGDVKDFRFFRMSRPGRRMYVKASELLGFGKGGTVILSTPNGILTSSEARKQKVGGEALLEIR
jgi:small subunit ribosomal protein S8